MELGSGVEKGGRCNSTITLGAFPLAVYCDPSLGRCPLQSLRLEIPKKSEVLKRRISGLGKKKKWSVWRVAGEWESGEWRVESGEWSGEWSELGITDPTSRVVWQMKIELYGKRKKKPSAAPSQKSASHSVGDHRSHQQSSMANENRIIWQTKKKTIGGAQPKICVTLCWGSQIPPAE